MVELVRSGARLPAHIWALEALAVLAGLTAIALWYFADVLAGQAHFILAPDTSEMIYPLEYRIAAALKEGVLPMWNPYSLSGYPLAGYPQYGLFYPINWVFWLWPYEGGAIYPIDGYHWRFVFHVILGGCGSYYLCRVLALGRIPAALAALAYMFLPNALMFSVWGNSQPGFAW